MGNQRRPLVQAVRGLLGRCEAHLGALARVRSVMNGATQAQQSDPRVREGKQRTRSDWSLPLWARVSGPLEMLLPYLSTHW